MKFIKEWNDFNPLNKEAKDFVEINKYNLKELWDNDLSDDENIQFMIDYFTEFPDEMKSSINTDNIKKASRNHNSLSANAPKFQNIGGTYDSSV